jgi:glycosyltransferase involved in cell wall biosynthesis
VRPGAPALSRVAVISANETPWGGSEELWQRAALALASRGLRVDVYKARLPLDIAPVARLRDAGCRLHDLARPLGLPMRLFGHISFLSRPFALLLLMTRLTLGLLLRRPDFVILSQGGNWDGLHFGSLLLRLKIPFVLVSQKATEFYWPPDHLSDRVLKLYQGCVHAYFVSEHNKRLTEVQLGEALRSASVVRNPFLVFYDAVPGPLPPGDTVDLACVGRIYPMEKGQDLLIQLLAKEKWRNRPITVTFYGEGIQRRSLERLGKLLGLDNLRFAGHVEDPAVIWARHPLLVLPSRCEGLPLVVVEAMLAGRVVVATDAGGTAEVIDDNATGFIAKASTLASLDDALERAWQARAAWPEIAASAASSIRTMVPADPGTDFTDDVLQRCSSHVNQESLEQPLGERQMVVEGKPC